MIIIPIIVVLIMFVISGTFYLEKYCEQNPNSKICKKWKSWFPPEDFED
jgi:uncharacterized protein YneF (UPF0154 family)